MKQIIKKIATKVIHPIATRLGYSQNLQQNTFSKNNLLDTFYLILKDIGFNPQHIVDIGANHGTWTREALLFFPNAQYSLLEPQYWLKESMEDLLKANSKITFYPVGAGKETGTFKFTILDRDDSCSFMYSEEEAKSRGYKQIDLPIVTLNDLAKEKNLPTPDIIKIDAEGLDLDVLDGASSFFGKTEIFMIEASVVNKLYENDVLKVLNYMDSKGYRFFEITDLNRPFPKQVLWLVEMAFVKKGGMVDSYDYTKNKNKE